jgi:anti-sigma B factor antagonist
MSDATLRLKTRLEPPFLIVRYDGDVDLRSAPEFHTLLQEVTASAAQDVILDLSAVRYMDSSAVGAIVDIKRRLERAKRSLILVGLQPRVRSVFEISKLDRFFVIAADLAEVRSR